MSDFQGGHECQFVEKPLQAVQSECPVCLLVLREPYQVNCCGYGFCRLCIEKVKADKKPCPCCNAKDFAQFEDKRLKRSLDAFRVHCSNKEQGCQWEGELGQLDNHLNYKPPREKQLEGCQYSQIKCFHCSELFIRSKIHVHQSDQCQRRPFSCEYCKDYDSYYEDVTTNHWPVCECYPLECSNKCGQTLERQHLESHISKDCPITVIDCDFQHVGCEVRLPRKHMPAHLVESVACHLLLQAVSFRQVVAKMKEENESVKQQVVRTEKENNELWKQVINLTEHLKICTPMCPVEFSMSNIEREHTEWNSPPFYVNPKGYKLCIKASLYPNSIHTYLVLMKGEFDDQLKWPFTGIFEVQLLNRYQDEEHHLKTINISVTKGNKKAEENEFWCSETIDLIPYDSLKQGCLKFRISLIDL